MIFFALENRLNFGLVLGPILVDFGPPKPSKMNRATPPLFHLEIVRCSCYVLHRFKRLQVPPRTPPRAPQEAPRGRQERPRRLQEGLKRPEEPANRALQLQRCPAKMPCHRMQGGDAESWRAGGGVPPKGKAIRRPDRRGGMNGVSDCRWRSAQAQVVEYYLSYSLWSLSSLGL